MSLEEDRGILNRRSLILKTTVNGENVLTGVKSESIRIKSNWNKK